MVFSNDENRLKELQDLRMTIQMAIFKVQEAVKQAALETREQMLDNLSGKDISWSKGIFQINVRTGNLRRQTRIIYPYNGDLFQAAVVNRAEYAQAIEDGVTGEQRKASYLRRGKSNKFGRKYRVIPMRVDGKVRFFTVTEKSVLRDIPEKPFSQATAEQMEGRIQTLLSNAVVDVFGK